VVCSLKNTELMYILRGFLLKTASQSPRK
jgi:hypothetical protein